MSSKLLTDVQQYLSKQRFREAANMLVSAAEKEDADALYMLATWRVSGQIVPRDTVAARDLMERAAAAGHYEAPLLLAHFTANGTGGLPDWERALEMLAALKNRATVSEQLRLLAQMDIDASGYPRRLPALEVLSEAPSVRTTSDFLTEEECDYLVQKAEPRLTPSIVTDRATGKRMVHPDRRSDGTFFGVGTEDLAVNAINRRIAAISSTRPEQAEPLQVFRYGVGGEFRPHFDSVREGGNQRILTALVYLSDDYEGGETRFLRVGLDFRGARGDLLLFNNATEDGRPDPLAEHAGLPVRSGSKIVASRWIWREPPHFPPPTPVLSEL